MKTTNCKWILIFILIVICFRIESNAALLSGTIYEVASVFDEIILDDFFFTACRCEMGVSAWEPFDADGEDQLYNYLGQCGVNLEPTPYFQPDAPVVLFTQSSGCEEDAVEKLEAYVRGECSGIRNIENGQLITEKITLPKPGMKGDATSVIPEPTEYAFEFTVRPGGNFFFEVI